MEKLREKSSSINNNGNIQVIKRANMKINLIPNLMANALLMCTISLSRATINKHHKYILCA